MKIDTNTVLSAVAIGLLTWVGTTLQNLDKQMSVVNYQIEDIKKQSYYPDCPFCNHHKHSHIGDWLDKE